MGVNKLSGKVLLKVNYSFNIIIASQIYIVVTISKMITKLLGMKGLLY